MDLMTLAAKIQLDSSDFDRGVRRAEGMGQQLTGKISAMTVAVGNLAADVMRKGITAINGVIGGAIDGYADYQQLIGGVETLFKTSTNKVSNYAKQSFKTTGLSANDYMETVTGFSASLLQGLKGDTDKAADYANMAIVDMADNANKMGTDMSSIQNAYQGFAKQNYTMLDNLKLGYGGTREEMIRLVNDSGILEEEISDLDGITFDQLVLAIHKIQEEMGITGTTAKEAADTISGSKASLKAAWEDMLSAVGGEGDQKRLDETLENFKTSFSTYMENFIPTLVTTITNSGSLVTAVAEAIASLPTDLLSKVAEGGLEAGTEMIGGVSKITHWLIESISSMFRSASADPSQITELGAAVGEFLGTAISDIVANAPDILEGIIAVGVSLAGGLIEGLFKGLFGEGAEVDKITEQLQEDLTDIDVNNAQATGILRYMDKLYEKFGKGVTRTNEWKEAQKQLEEVLPAAGGVFKNYGNDIQGALDTLEKLNKSMRENAIISGMENALREEKELYGEQMATAELAKTRADIAREKKAAAEDVLPTNLQAYAKAWLSEYGAEDWISDAARQEAEGILSGKIYENGQMVDLTAAEASTLENALMTFAAALEGTENEVWSKSDTDTIYDPDTVAKMYASIGEYEATIKENEKIAKEAEKEAAATQKEIDITTAALTRAIADRAESYGYSVEEMQTSTGQAAVALDKFAMKLAGIRIGAGGEVYMPEATGIDYVPFDGFKAELHRGETVLPASEAKERRSGDGTAEIVGALQGLRQDMQNLRIMVGKKTFGRAVVDYGGDRLSGFIGNSNSRSESGYGT